MPCVHVSSQKQLSLTWLSHPLLSLALWMLTRGACGSGERAAAGSSVGDAEGEGRTRASRQACTAAAAAACAAAVRTLDTLT
eukprot:353547-Chlamydomonas_euryale.AAC.3